MISRVVVIDDHAIVRLGLETLIGTDRGLELIASADSLRDGLEAIHEHQPDLVISDIALGDSRGLETIRHVVAAQQPRPTLVISMYDEMLYGEQVLALGASGYLMKESAHEAVLEAAHIALSGGIWISAKLNASLLSRSLHRPPPGARTDTVQESLTLREIEILEMLKTGKTTKEIAFALALSARTVDIHRANLKRKLGLRSGTELIAYALRRP